MTAKYIWNYKTNSFEGPCSNKHLKINMLNVLVTIMQNLQSLQSFTWVSWGYLPSADISFRPQFRRFLFSFLGCYVFSKWSIYFFILAFSHSILFCLFLLLYTTFPVFYFLSFSSVCLCISSTFSLSFCLLYFSSDFLYLSSTFPFCFCLFLCLLLSFLDLFYFLFLPVFFYVPLTLQFIFAYMCVLLLLLLFYSSFFYFVPFNFLSAFFGYFSTLFSLLFIFSCCFFYSLWLSCSNPGL